MNFKGGSGKTTTAAHLAQWLALHGYRTLALDLDPQASLSALFGHQPELDVGPNESLYGAIRYDDPRPIAEIIRGTYIPDLHIVPGNLELQEFEYDTPRALMGRDQNDTMFFARVGQVLGEVQIAAHRLDQPGDDDGKRPRRHQRLDEPQPRLHQRRRDHRLNRLEHPSRRLVQPQASSVP